ncbi:MAG: primosomal protein N', partial [Acetobacteraceae bacterium]
MEGHEAVPERVPVLLPLPLEGPYDYAVPQPPEGSACALAPGTIVTVPLGPRRLHGVVWHGGSGVSVPAERLRAIDGVVDAPPLSPALLRFVDWVAAYTLAPLGEVLRLALPLPAAVEPPRPRTGWRAADPPPQGVRLTPERARVLSVLAAAPGLAWSGAELARAAGVTPGVLRGMAEAGLLEPAVLVEDVPRPDPSARAPALGPDQAAAARRLREAVAARRFAVHLLDGVTGSGKTEVYLEAVAETVACGRQALVLLPEIALSAQVIERFTARFGVAPTVWHSEVGAARRRAAHRAVAEGRAPIVIGARSALWLNFADLGLIVVDEEHETAFKQEEGVPYNARDMAVVRAQLEGAPCLLVSATPSLETLANVERGRYARLHLPERHGTAGLPGVTAVDLRRHPPPRGRFLSPPLVEGVGGALGRREQALLFLNRRGFAPLTLCRACGHRFACTNCTAWLVEHRYSRALQCHHCGHVEPLPAACPACGAEGTLAAIGPGVERVAEEARALFPDAHVLEMSSDTVKGAIQASAMAAMIENREVDIIVGTQLVAKGWHFPHLTLVGVIDADLGLAGGDLRAAERTFQI